MTMGTRKCILVSSVVVIWLVSGYSAHSLASGRSAKILEDPIVSQGGVSSYEVVSSDFKGTALQDNSDRSLNHENNMMLYRSVFTLSLKLLTVFLVIRLLTTGLTSAGVLGQSRPVPIVPFPGQPGQQLHSVDVNYNPGLTLHQGSAIAAGNAAGGSGAGSSLLSTGANGGTVHAISTGAAAGASSGTAPLQGGYLTAANQPRPSYLPLRPPPPRFRLFGLGGPRHPPLRRPSPQHMMPNPYAPFTQHNMGEQTQYVDTHTHLLVMPDGTHARVPNVQIAALPQQVNKPVASQATSATSVSSSSSSSNTQQDSKSSASSNTETSTERASVETVSVSTSSSRNGQPVERRSSNVFKDASSSYLHQLQHQPYDDWNLHFSPGT